MTIEIGRSNLFTSCTWRISPSLLSSICMKDEERQHRPTWRKCMHMWLTDRQPSYSCLLKELWGVNKSKFNHGIISSFECKKDKERKHRQNWKKMHAYVIDRQTAKVQQFTKKSLWVNKSKFNPWIIHSFCMQGRRGTTTKAKLKYYW